MTEYDPSLNPAEGYWTVGIDMQSSQTIASVFLGTPGFASLDVTYGGFASRLTGYLTIGDSKVFTSNPKCTDVSDAGY